MLEKEIKEKKKNDYAIEDIGKYLFDLSKMLIGSFVLGVVIKGEGLDIPAIKLIWVGLLGAGICFVVGYLLIIISREK